MAVLTGVPGGGGAGGNSVNIGVVGIIVNPAPDPVALEMEFELHLSGELDGGPLITSISGFLRASLDPHSIIGGKGFPVIEELAVFLNSTPEELLQGEAILSFGSDGYLNELTLNATDLTGRELNLAIFRPLVFESETWTNAPVNGSLNNFDFTNQIESSTNTIVFSPIPEPGISSLITFTLAGLLALGRRRQRR